jgi:hypothetical protein
MEKLLVLKKLLGFKNQLDGKITYTKKYLDSKVDWMEKLLIIKKLLELKKYLYQKITCVKKFLAWKIFL